MPGRRPNIVWISLESVRADHTSPNGYERETSPHLQRIADDSRGVSFAHCYAQSMWTPASTASMLTGTHLFRHGVGLNEAEDCFLSPTFGTLPALLSNVGYTTACPSTSAFLSHATNLGQGFDRFHWLRKPKSGIAGPETVLPILKYLSRIRSYGPGVALEGKQHSQRGRIRVGRDRPYDPNFDSSRYHEPPLTALRDETYKLLHSADRTVLVVPPDETTDVSNGFPTVRERLETKLRDCLDEMVVETATGSRQAATFTDEMREQLSDLGYV